MKIILHNNIAEIISTETLVKNGADMLQLCMDIVHDYDDVRTVVLHQHNVVPTFFDLSTGVAGGIAQKLVNYDFYAGIVGDFGGMESKSLKAFMLESNKGRRLVFADSVDAAVTALSA
jgi:hypothetical protein